jgi:NO-binding membrane sensor protein with MHYT domain
MSVVSLVPEYHLWLVFVSFVVASLGAYTALSVMASQLANGGGRINWISTASAGLALGGVGIWSMHFLGMLAFDAHVGVGYSVLETVVSLVAAVVVSTVALGYLASQPFSIKRLLIAGPLAGLGVAVMHYLGMYGMRFGGFFDWSAPLVILSVAIAIVAATVALWLAFHTPKKSHRVAAAVLMGVAVCTMHYTGMAAASLLCTTPTPSISMAGLLRSTEMLGCVIAVALGVVAIVGVDLQLQRMHRAMAR